MKKEKQAKQQLIQFLLVIIMCCSALQSRAQEIEVVKQYRLDSNYVEDYTEWLTTRLFILYQDAEFTMEQFIFLL